MTHKKRKYKSGNMPFSIYSSSVDAGYEITNLHEDTYGGIKDAPMQGPFTYQYVGGNQHRHIPLNTGSDSAINRPELFRINITSSGEIRVVGPNSGSTLYPRAIRTRGETAKRPVNIANIQMRTGSTIIGNYEYDYEVIQTVGRTSNNRSFVEAEGAGFIGDPSLPYSGSLVTQYVRPALPPFPCAGQLWWPPVNDGYENKKCLSIDGAAATDGSYLELVGATGLNWDPSLYDFTISAWFKMDPGTTGTNYIVSKIDRSAATYQYAIGVDGLGNVFSHCGTWIATISTGTDYRDGKWHNVIVASAVMNSYMWVDGSNLYVGSVDDDEVATDPLIGAAFDGTTPVYMFEGEIDEVSFWDTQFSVTTVAELYNDGVPADLTLHSAYADLATWLRMGDGTGDTLATIIDQGPDGNNATLQNAGTPPTPASLQELTCQSDSIIAGTYVNLRPYTQNYAPDRTLPVFTPQETVFVNRFNAPGGPDVSSRGVLDTYAEETAPNNAMPWRNNAVRSVLRSDLTRHTPKATDITCSVTPTLYHSNNRNTRYYKQTPPTSSNEVLVSGLSDPDGIALDSEAGMMYWVDVAGDTIYRAPMDGGPKEALLSGLDSPQQIALDTCSGLMYFTENGYGAGAKIISRSPMDGGAKTVLVSGLTDPRGIALDAPSQTIYWTDYTLHLIQRAPMDGGTAVTVYDPAGTLNFIALDIGARMVYWMNHTQGIQCAPMNGNGPIETVVTLLLGANGRGVALDTSLGFVYWAEVNTSVPDGIFRVPIKGGPEETLTFTGPTPNGIALDLDGGKMYWTDGTDDNITRANMPEKPVYDNAYVTHAIPQCSLQYSWIKASAITDRTELLGYQNSGSY